MSRRRRAVLLGALALLLGALAASDVAGREAALRRGVGPLVDVVVARRPLAPGMRLDARSLAVRRVPARFAPRGAFAGVDGLAGARMRAAVPAGADLSPAALADDSRDAPGAPVRRGERVADVVAVAPAGALGAGVRADVLVTRAHRTTLALEDVEVLAARPATGAEAEGRLVASLRVTLRQAVYLAAAQSFAREIRLLPRAAGDARRGASGLTITDGL